MKWHQRIQSNYADDQVAFLSDSDLDHGSKWKQDGIWYTCIGIFPT